MILTGLSLAQKGTGTAITLNKTELFNLAPILANPYFSDQANVKSAQFIYKSNNQRQLEVLTFDLSESQPVTNTSFSQRAFDVWNLNRIILKDFDGGKFIIQGNDLPAGLGVTMGSLTAATATIQTTAPIILTSTLMGIARNGNTFKTRVNPPDANPQGNVIVDFAGSNDQIICTVTPDNNTNLTTQELVELINSGSVQGKSTLITGQLNFRTFQTATGGNSAVMQDGGLGKDTLFLDMEGAYIVNKAYSYNPVAINGATLVTSHFKNGTQSLNFIGHGQSCVTFSPQVFNPGSQDWTVEGWFYFVALDINQYQALWSSPNTSDGNSTMLYIEPQVGGALCFVYTPVGSPRLGFVSSFTPANGQWYNIAVSRQNDKVKVFVNGSNVGEGDISGDLDVNPSNFFYLANYPYFPGNVFNGFGGYIDDFKITIKPNIPAGSGEGDNLTATFSGGTGQPEGIQPLIGIVTTAAGTGTVAGYKDGKSTGTQALFYGIWGIAPDNAGNIYIADNGDYKIKKMDSSGLVTSIAGTGILAPTQDGPGLTAVINDPTGICFDQDNNCLYVSTQGSTSQERLIRKIDLSSPSYTVTTIAGGAVGDYDDPNSGLNSSFSANAYCLIYNAGNIYLADTNNSKIKVVSATGGNGVYTLAGDGTPQNIDGQGTSASLLSPYVLACDQINGYLYVGGVGYISRINLNTTDVAVIAGSPEGYTDDIDDQGLAARFAVIRGLTLNGTNLYIADQGNNKIKCMDPNLNVFTVAGSGPTPGTDLDDQGTSASFDYGMFDLKTDSSNGSIYLAASWTIRKIDPLFNVTTVAGDFGNQGANAVDGYGVVAKFDYPVCIAIDPSGVKYIADQNNFVIRKLDLNNNVTTVAGKHGIASLLDGQGLNAGFNYIVGMTIDAAGNLYVLDGSGTAIRKIDTSYNVTTYTNISGSFTAIVADPAGNLYVFDQNALKIGLIDSLGTSITYIAGSGAPGIADGTGAEASFTIIVGMTRDSAGNLYVVQNQEYALRKIDTSYNVTTLISSNQVFQFPGSITISPLGTLFLQDGSVVKKIDAPYGAANVSTVAGDGNWGYLDAYNGLTAQFTDIYGLVMDQYGNIYLCDASNHVIRKID